MGKCVCDGRLLNKLSSHSHAECSRSIICLHIKVQKRFFPTTLINVLGYHERSVLNSILLRNWSYLKVETVI